MNYTQYEAYLSRVKMLLDGFKLIKSLDFFPHFYEDSAARLLSLVFKDIDFQSARYLFYKGTVADGLLAMNKKYDTGYEGDTEEDAGRLTETFLNSYINEE